MMQERRIAVACSVVSFVGLVACGAPKIADNSVTVSQDESTRVVKVSYSLVDAPAVVTVNVLTNGTPVSPSAMWHVSGAVNRLVDGAGPHEILWSPDDAFPEIGEVDISAELTVWAPDAPPPYMAVDLSLTNSTLRPSRFYYADEASVPGTATNRLYKSTVLLMRLIPAAEVRWRMGGPKGEVGMNDATRETIHYVTLSSDYYIGVYPVTQLQYAIVGGGRDSTCKGPGFPDADFQPVDYCSYNELRGSSVSWPADLHKVASGSGVDLFRKYTGIASFDLPTDAQWEYACRAGTATSLNSGCNITDANVDAALDEVAWYRDNSGLVAHEVGLKKPNNWGLYDMHGNVLEWVLDWYSTGSTHYCEEGADVRDPKGDDAPVNKWRIQRGGGWNLNARANRSAWRGYTTPGNHNENSQGGFGFRLVCDAVAE